MFVESDTFASPTCTGTYIFVTVISSSLQESDVFGSTCMMLSIGTSFSMIAFIICPFPLPPDKGKLNLLSYLFTFFWGAGSVFFHFTNFSSPTSHPTPSPPSPTSRSLFAVHPFIQQFTSTQIKIQEQHFFLQ